MTEFDDIFAYALPTAVYFSISLGFIIAYALGAVWMLRHPQAVEPRWIVRRA